MWKYKQQSCTKDETNQKGVNPAIDHTKWHFGDISYHKDIDRHRRDDDADHRKNMEDDAKPNRIVTKFDDDRKEDWSGQDQKSEVIDKRASQYIDKQNENHQQERWKRELPDPICN